MNCFNCEKEAVGVCVFCGRAICKKHVQKLPNILAAYDEDRDKPKVIVVKDALYCGICKPLPQSVSLEDLE